MIYLLIGEDVLAKDQKIREVQEQNLPSEDAKKFDYELLHGNKLDPAELKKSLITLPVMASKRVVVIRAVNKLNTQNKKIVLEFAQSNPDHVDLVLDAPEANLKTSFYAKISSIGKLVRFQQGVSQNVFDMTKAMTAQKPAEALRILTELFSAGDHPLQIMGGLVWYWGSIRTRLSRGNFQKGLLLLQEADLNIKRSRLKAESAVEVLVAKLSYLI